LHRERKTVETEAHQLLDSVGMKHAARRYPESLSGGEQQRVAIARALAMRPGVLLFDEPTSALDPKRTASMKTLLRGVASQGHTLFIISHSIGFLAGVADSVLFLDGGQVVEHGPTSEVLNSPKDSRTRDFLSTAH
jgi:ABC-type polar amino acid transport system ATPase subunit